MKLKKIFNIFIVIFMSLMIFIIALEIGAYVLVKYQLLPINEKPISEFHVGAPRGLSWRNENSEWGAWHKTNVEDKHISSCIDAEYKSNNYGARDENFNLDTVADYLLIGDSFAEGYGVNIEESVESKLEKKLNANIYNFGSAGHFGPIQYYLIYSKLAKLFKHKGVLIFLLPANDFTDNDPKFWTGRDVIDITGAQRYRPYWKPIGKGIYDWFYPEKAMKTDCFGCPPPTIRTFLIRYTYMGSVVRTLELLYPNLFKYRKNKELLPDPSSYSGYFDSMEKQQKAAVFFIEKIITESKPTPVRLVVIPAKNDLERIENGEKYQDQLWFQWLNKMKSKHNNFKFIDLSESKPKDYKDLFLSCDGHWSPQGHSWAAHYIGEFLR